MEITESIKSPYIFEETLPDTSDLTPVFEQIDVVNKMAEKHGFSKVEFDKSTRIIHIDYKAKESQGMDVYEAAALAYKNSDMERVIYKLVCLCKVLVDKPEIKLLDGTILPCYPASHVAVDYGIDKNSDRQLFYSNVNLFLDNADVILNDSRMFLAPVYCGKTCFTRSVPTLGVYVEFWRKCREMSVEKNGLPIYYISGNPMTGSHACAALTLHGVTVKPTLKICFIDLLKLFELI